MTQLSKPLLDPLRLTCPRYRIMPVLREGDGLTVSAPGQAPLHALRQPLTEAQSRAA